MTNDFQELVNFLNDQGWEYKFQLKRDTQIENEMGITGDDAIDLIIKFGKLFKVDVSNFMAAEYFGGEGIDILSPIVRIFTGRKEVQKKMLTLGNLENAMRKGRLDEESINAI